MYRLLSLAISLVLLGSLSAEAQVTLKHKTAENSRLSTTVKTSTSQVLTIVGMDLETKRTMTYKGVEMTASGKKLHVITGVTNDAQLVQSPDVKGSAPVSDSKLTVKSSSIRILFDNELGRPTISEYKLQLAGSITLTINGMALPCQIDLTMDIAAATR